MTISRTTSSTIAPSLSAATFGRTMFGITIIYSKGAGLFFLAMLLTDPLPPQIISFIFFAASLIALFLLLQRVALNSRWVWASVILYIGLFVYTPGVGGSRGLTADGATSRSCTSLMRRLP